MTARSGRPAGTAAVGVQGIFQHAPGRLAVWLAGALVVAVGRALCLAVQRLAVLDPWPDTPSD